MESELLSKPEAARKLGGISVTTLDRLRACGEVDTIRVRGRVFLCARSVAAYIERQRSGSPGRAAIEAAFPLPRFDARRAASRARREQGAA
jgi:hypothetical protein